MRARAKPTNVLAVCSSCGAPRIERVDTSIEQLALREIARDLEGAPEDCWRFFWTLFTCDLSVKASHMLARELAVGYTTMQPRFHRAGLPGLKRYLDWARLVRGAGLFRAARATIESVAVALDYSAPTSLNRIAHRLTGMAPLQWYAMHTPSDAVTAFRQEMILPYRETLLRFHPLLPQPIGRRRRLSEAA